VTQVPIGQQDVQLDPITMQVVRLLNDMGIMFPTPIDQKSIKQFPLDITQAGMLELGELHSYWTAMHARDSGVHGMIKAQKRSLKFSIGKMKPGLTNSDPKIKAQASIRMNELEAMFARVDAMDAIMEAVVDGHKRYAEACSRELSRRQIEATLSR
jgi:hypothetical protein